MPVYTMASVLEVSLNCIINNSWPQQTICTEKKNMEVTQSLERAAAVTGLWKYENVTVSWPWQEWRWSSGSETLGCYAGKHIHYDLQLISCVVLLTSRCWFGHLTVVWFSVNPILILLLLFLVRVHVQYSVLYRALQSKSECITNDWQALKKWRIKLGNTQLRV